MPSTSDASQPELYIELLQLFEHARQFRAKSTRFLDLARQTRATIPAASDAPVRDDHPSPPTAAVALTPEQALDAIITLLGDFSLEPYIAITKALARGMTTMAHTQLSITRPPVA